MDEDDDWSGAVRAASAAAAVALLAWASWRMHDTLLRFDRFFHDDAYITLRYAQQVLAGNGPVWNPGERVEGYSSPVALAGIVVLGAFAPLESAARALNVVGVALLASAVGWFAWKRASGPLRPVVAAIPVALAITNAPLLTWVQGGLEGPLAAGVIAGALALTIRSTERPEDRRLMAVAGLALGVVPLVRPDGVAFVVAAVAGWVAIVRTREALRFAGFALALPAAHLLFRLAFYGSVVANSVRVKTTGLPPNDLWSAGWAYLKDFAVAPPWIAAAGAVAGLALLATPRWRPAALLLGALALHAVGITASGGDHMVSHRLLLPLLAPALLLVALGLVALGELRHRARLIVFLAAGAGSVAAIRAQDAEYPSIPADPAAYVGTIVGRWLAATEPPGTLVALNTAGSTPFHAPGLRFVDTLGLNDPHIARREIDAFRLPFQRWPGHGKGDGAYVLERAPDVVIVGPAEGCSIGTPWFLGDLELKEDPRFAERYRKRTVEIPVDRLPDHGRYRATRDGTMPFTFYERVP